MTTIAVECTECHEFVSAEAAELAIARNITVLHKGKRHLWVDKRNYEITDSSSVLHWGLTK